ncbi:MAG: class I SAM-dependent methyltransferase [Actinomyces sp.]|nr:MAG: class I SAM-dependent methyltransferase [Actinomyces sp.]
MTPRPDPGTTTEASSGRGRPAAYGDAFADVYDEWYGEVTDAEATADVVADLAAGRRVLELGVGTGRLAAPLIRRGVRLVGVDASAAMLERLARRLPHPLGVRADMAALPVADATIGLVLCAVNTVFNLVDTPPTPPGRTQRAAFAEAARVLEPGGLFLVETTVVTTDPPPAGVSVTRRSADGLVLAATRFDPHTGVVAGQHVELGPGHLRVRPWWIRPLTPAAIDALAAAVGLVPAHHWADWSQRPFTADDPVRITAYRRP